METVQRVTFSSKKGIFNICCSLYTESGYLIAVGALEYPINSCHVIYCSLDDTRFTEIGPLTVTRHVLWENFVGNISWLHCRYVEKARYFKSFITYITRQEKVFNI